MRMNYYIYNATIINENKEFLGDIVIKNGVFDKVIPKNNKETPEFESSFTYINAENLIAMPGIIDDQVHFREPGLTHKGDLYTESKAAIAGGITSFMEMPNTIPNAVTNELLDEKFKLAGQKSWANYSFFMGATNDNLEELKKTDFTKSCGIKIFMGSSTGNMLVDKRETLESIFREINALIAVHAEDEQTIKTNLNNAIQQFGNDIPPYMHPIIRNYEACLLSSSLAVELAKKYNSRLHVLHLTTADELNLLDNSIPLNKKRITAEVCVHHLWFDDSDYECLGNKIKCNPAIKKVSDRKALLEALIEDKIDIIATDHAPHTLEEKTKPYLQSASGLPLVQHALHVMIDFYRQGSISLTKIVEKMCHNPAICYGIQNRGFIREGYYADLVLVDLNKPYSVSSQNILYKCGWSPFEGQEFHSSVEYTFVNGHLSFNRGVFDETSKGMALKFNKR